MHREAHALGSFRKVWISRFGGKHPSRSHRRYLSCGDAVEARRRKAQSWNVTAVLRQPMRSRAPSRTHTQCHLSCECWEDLRPEERIDVLLLHCATECATDTKHVNQRSKIVIAPRPRLAQSWTKLGQIRANSGQIRQRPSQFGPSLVELGPNLVDIGTTLVEFGPISTESGPLVASGPMLVKLDCFRAKSGESRAESGRKCSTRPKSTKLWTELADVDRMCPNLPKAPPARPAWTLKTGFLAERCKVAPIIKAEIVFRLPSDSASTSFSDTVRLSMRNFAGCRRLKTMPQTCAHNRTCAQKYINPMPNSFQA